MRITNEALIEYTAGKHNCKPEELLASAVYSTQVVVILPNGQKHKYARSEVEADIEAEAIAAERRAEAEQSEAEADQPAKPKAAPAKRSSSQTRKTTTKKE